MPPETATSRATRKLPPLILHPFSDSSSPGKLMDGSRASLMLQGILPNEHQTEEHLQEMLLEGRVCEVRMLFYVGKDLLRWIEQCVDFLSRDEGSESEPLRMQSFATFLVNHAPEPVRAKLISWGVQDYRSIFSRAIGLNAVFGTAPTRETLSELFIRNYHTYSDGLYATWLKGQNWKELSAKAFDFDLYASAEYSRLLEQQWTEEA